MFMCGCNVDAKGIGIIIFTLLCGLWGTPRIVELPRDAIVEATEVIEAGRGRMGGRNIDRPRSGFRKSVVWEIAGELMDKLVAAFSELLVGLAS
jgi:hypothetical protein